MRVIVCGSRTFTDRAVINSVLNGLWWPELNESQPRLLTIIEGGARGADEMAGDWARRTAGVDHVTVPAEWLVHSRRAGPIRNHQMLTEHGHIDLVVAFVNKPLARSVGTADMVRRARHAEVPTWVIEVSAAPGPSRSPSRAGSGRR